MMIQYLIVFLLQIGECLASESLAGVNSTIIYSVEFCVGRRGCQNDGYVGAIKMNAG